MSTDPVQNDEVTQQSETELDQSNTTLANQPSDSSEENLGTEYNDDGNRRLAGIRLSKQLSDVAFTDQSEHTSDSANYFLCNTN